MFYIYIYIYIHAHIIHIHTRLHEYTYNAHVFRKAARWLAVAFASLYSGGWYPASSIPTFAPFQSSMTITLNVDCEVKGFGLGL